jgi:hypothetical protein
MIAPGEAFDTHRYFAVFHSPVRLLRRGPRDGVSQPGDGTVARSERRGGHGRGHLQASASNAIARGSSMGDPATRDGGYRATKGAPHADRGVTSGALRCVDLVRQHRRGSFTRAPAGVSARPPLIAFSSDWPYPPSPSREIDESIGGLGKRVEFHVIGARDGQDRVLLDEARQTPIIRLVLDALP